MRRREFISLIGGAAAWPLAVRAQQGGPPVRRVGMLMTVMESDPATQNFITLFQRRLAELGWVEDGNVRFNRRWAAGNPERIRANVTEIVGLRPDVIVAQNTPMVAALHKETDSIPIVFVQVSDPVGDGFVETLARPGGSDGFHQHNVHARRQVARAVAGGRARHLARRISLEPCGIPGPRCLFSGPI